MDFEPFVLEFYNLLASMFGGHLPRNSLYYVVIGRAIFTLAFLVYWKNLGGPRAIKERWFWAKHTLKEIPLIVFGLFYEPFAMFLLGYSLVMASAFFRMAWMKSEQGGFKFLHGLFSILFNPVAPTLGIAYLVYDALDGGTSVVVAGAAMLGYGLAMGLRYFPLSRIRTVEAHVAVRSMNAWNRSRVGKYIIVGAIAAMAVTSIAMFQVTLFDGRGRTLLRMRDGTLLYTRVHLPANESAGPFPVILYRTPYDVESMDAYVQGYTDAGYAVVLQDVRGTPKKRAFMPFQIFQTEMTDGNDTVNWILEQPWCNGNIATEGGSAGAATQLYNHAGGANIKAAIIHSGAADLYQEWFFTGGCLQKWFVDSWLDAVNGWSSYPTMLQHAAKDSYWDAVSVAENNNYARVNVRAVHLGGWYDCFQQGTIDSFMLYNHNATAYARDHQILVMGTMVHGVGHEGVPEYNSLEYGFTYANPAKEFIYGEALFGQSRNWITQPRVYYIVFGDPAAEATDPKVNQWRTAMDWPVASTREAWYLQPDGTLSNSTPSVAGNMSYIYDPENPVLNGGGTTFTLNCGAYDNQVVENRDDILKFTTPVLTAPVEITGRLRATLNVASNCTDTDFTAKLLDVYPDGRQIIIADGILKTRYRDGFRPEDVAFMTPGNVYTLDVDMWSMAYRFSPGHRIRMSITSSNYPKFAVNPNTGGPVMPDFTTHFDANNTLLLGQGSTPSCIWFPRTE